MRCKFDANLRTCSLIYVIVQGIAPTIVVARVAAGHAAPKSKWPWDTETNTETGVRSNQGPLVSFPRFLHASRDIPMPTNETLTRTYHDHEDLSGDVKPKEVV